LHAENAIMMSFAAAFVDQSDERKPIVLVISDQKLPVENRSKDFLLLPSSSSLARRPLANGAAGVRPT
jgi:hypothetical protein